MKNAHTPSGERKKEMIIEIKHRNKKNYKGEMKDGQEDIDILLRAEKKVQITSIY